MIAQLSGKILSKSPTVSVIDCHGVGYEVFHTPFTAETLKDTSISLYIHTHVREDALQLFGFATAGERKLFRELLKISNIGPKLALAILSGIPYPDLIAALSQKNAERIQKIPGVGKKTADRLLVELGDRMRKWDVGATDSPTGDQTKEEELQSVLTNLGYQKPEIQKALKLIRTREENFASLPLETLVKTTLRELTQARSS